MIAKVLTSPFRSLSRFVKDEAALPEGGIEGDEAFQLAFTANAHKNQDGRSLKDFQLLTRLFKYRCSYMIHSQTFTHLQPDLKKAILHRLNLILENQDPSDHYTYLGTSERKNIQSILKETLVGE